MDYNEIPGVYEKGFSKCGDGNYKNTRNKAKYKFTLKKDITFDTETSYIKHRDRIIKLDQDREGLEKDFEGKINVPDFCFEYDDDKLFLSTESEFVKGLFLIFLPAETVKIFILENTYAHTGCFFYWVIG